MKNMKKTIVGVAILAIALIVMMGSVHAASMTVDKTEVKKGDIVTVSINVDKQVNGIQFNLKYNPNNFEYIKSDAGNLQPEENATSGLIKLVASSGSKTGNKVTLQFKALADTQGEDFVVSNFKAEGEALNNSSVKVKVSTKVEEPTQPAQPGNNDNKPAGTTTESDKKQQSADTITKTQKASEKVGTNGKVITKLPQTGTPIFIGVAALIVVAGAILVVKKVK